MARMQAMQWLGQGPYKLYGSITDPDELSMIQQVLGILRRAVNENASLSDGQQIYANDCLVELCKDAKGKRNLDFLPLVNFINGCK